MREKISSTANKQIKNVVQLQKKTKERKAQQCFIAEGQRLLRETPADLLQEVYVSEHFNLRQDVQLREQLFDWENSGGRIRVVTDAVFAHMSDTQTPQGILAVVKMPKYTLRELLKTRRRCCF